MAKVYYNAAGAILGYSHTDAEDAIAFPSPPAGQAPGSPLAFDETTNAAALQSLDGQVTGFRFSDHTCPGGVLTRKGAAMTIAAPSAAFSDRQAVRANLAALFTALRAGTATAAQQQRVLAFLLRQFLQG